MNNHITAAQLADHLRCEEDDALALQAELAAMRRRDANRYSGMSCAQVLRLFEQAGFGAVTVRRGSEGVIVEGLVDEIPGHLREAI